MGEKLSILNGSSFILADKKNNYKSLDDFEFRQDSITYYGESSTRASYCCDRSSTFMFDSFR